MPGRFARNLFLLLSPLSAVQCLGLAAFVFLAGSDGLQNAVANGDTRTLTFRHTHREEDDFTVTFKRNGKYDEAELAKLNYYLRDWRNDKEIKMDPHLFDIVWEVYREVGGKKPIEVISSYRSPETNSMLRHRSRGVARFSQHMLGKALDFRIPDVALEELRYAGLRLQRGGVGFYPGSDFVHLDTGSVRHWPRMAPDMLAKVMSGKPSVQLASAERRRMPAPSADEDESETVKPVVAARTAARKPTPATKPATVASAPNAQQAFALASAESRPFQLGGAPRPARAAASAETTASVQSWLNDIDSRPENDRVAPETALSYAAAASAPEPPQRTASLVNPMPIPRAAATIAQASRTSGKPTVQVKAGQRFDDPWLRSVALAVNMHYSRVTMYGPFDVRGVQALMRKPTTIVALTFGREPYEGLGTNRFEGSAVAFLPTVAFRQRQASLR